jgi:hypothetical protein
VGEWDGDVIRGLLGAAASDEPCDGYGALADGMGEPCEPIEPKLICGRPFMGTPLGVAPLVPCGPMIIEAFRPDSVVVLDGVPLALAAWGPPCCAIEVAPFTGDSVLGLAFCAGAEAPAGGRGDEEAVLVADA